MEFVDRQKWHDWYAPLPVVMITSKNRDRSFRCSPFTWVLPLSKKSVVAVMMRKESKTLGNVEREWVPGGNSLKLVLSWLPGDVKLAQKVLETRRPEAPYEFSLSKVDGWPLPVPKMAIASHLCSINGIFSAPLMNLTTHRLVSLSIEEEIVFREDASPLMFSHSKLFYDLTPYKVRGY